MFLFKKVKGYVIILPYWIFNCHAGGMVMADIDELKKKLEDGWIKVNLMYL